MDAITAAGTLLASDLDNRELTYRILPFGEPGRTNLGSIIASAHTLDIPADPSLVTFNEEHDFTRPVGRATSIIEDAQGITATFKIASTSRGDDILVEAAEGLRTGASVEIDQPVIRDGHLMSGRLTAVAAVVRPAFPSAQLVAADCGELTNSQEGNMPEQAPAATTDVVTEAAPAVENIAMVAAQAPAGLHAPQNTLVASLGPDADEAMRLIATAFNSIPEPSQLQAALTVISQTGVFDKMTQPQWVGELYAKKLYTRKYAPLISNEDLTSMTIEGFKFTAEPTVADYTAGSEPSTGAVTATKVSQTAARIAGGWKVDRMYTDFSVASFWTSFFKLAFSNYDRVLDLKVPVWLQSKAGSTPGTADVVGAAPSGVSTAAHLIVEGAMALIDDYNPTFALVDTVLYKAWLKTRTQDDLNYINAALGLQGGSTLGIQVVPWSGLGDDEVIVGDKNAATLYELPGTPVRVDATAISTGQTEHGVFGYYALMEENAAALSYVSVSNA